jgi:hypothetical protein
MPRLPACTTRRDSLRLLAATAIFGLGSTVLARAAGRPRAVMTRNPGCGCCENWAGLLRDQGFEVEIIDSETLDAVKAKLGVPADLFGCHTTQLGGYLIEGHVPMDAVLTLLLDKPAAAGLSVPGMPQGSPGMGGDPEVYEVIQFGPSGRKSFGRYRGETKA